MANGAGAGVAVTEPDMGQEEQAGGQWRCLTASPSLQPCHLHLGRGRRSCLQGREFLG